MTTEVIKTVSIYSTSVYSSLLLNLQPFQHFSSLLQAHSPPLFARARYNNSAEAEDELTFFKDEILKVLQKDYNGQVDWWLCQLRDKVGMVPANYLEIFHSHAPTKGDAADADYAVPKNQKAKIITSAQQLGLPPHEVQNKYADYDIPRGTPVSQGSREGEDDIYDHPPRDDDDPTNRDYDLPPNDEPMDVYDRPPSAKSSRSGLSNRYSGTSLGSSGLYDVPPSPSESQSGIYDMPPMESSPLFPNKHIVDDGRQTSSPFDVTDMDDNEAEELLSAKKKELDQEFDNLWKCVYGNDAYWGSENKARKSDTLRRTITAAKKFDSVLHGIVRFGRGVTRSLENSKDANFKRKFMTSNNAIASKRQEILVKIDVLVLEDEKEAPVTTTVKLLLEVARSVPQAVQSFAVLVLANRVILFRASSKLEDSLPVLTKTEVKTRPLPEVPEQQKERKSVFDDDYAIADEPPKSVSPSPMPVEWSRSISRRRNPHDELPPLPYATLRRAPEKKHPLPTTSPSHPFSSLKIVDAGHADADYDMIDAPSPSPSSIRHLAAPNFSSPSSRSRLHRQSSGSTHSASSEESHSPRRGNSPEHHLIGGPYGYIMNGTNHSRSGSPHPLRQEDRDLLNRYGQQMDLLVPSLREAMESFIMSIRNNEPPKDFVTKSKLVVVSAYKLVYIADALYQKVLHNDTKAAIVACSNNLTESIKALVSDTKTAALQHPSVKAIGRMLECLKKLFPTAMDLVSIVKCPSSISLV